MIIKNRLRFLKITYWLRRFYISKITRLYVQKGDAVIRNIGKGTWLDCGTPETLFSAGLMAMEGDISSSFD